MKLILVPVADRPECARALRTAFALSKRLEASLTGCHIRAHSDSKVTLSSEFSAQYFGASSRSADHIWSQKANNETSIAARKLFETIAKANDYSIARHPRATAAAIWQEKVGAPDKVLRIVGPVNDLIIVTRPSSKRSEVARLFMLSSLMETGRPVMVLPKTGAAKVGKNVCIAWNQSIEAARAVTSAMSILQAADNVTIVSCGPENLVGPKTQHLVNYLSGWGIKTQKIKTRGKQVNDELMDSYYESQSDLLIMGAYSRSRWRERVFGGTSQYMMAMAKIPVLLLHS